MRRRWGFAGVSLLLEIIFGMGLFAAALLLVFGLLPTSHRALTQAKNYALANGLAREYMERERVRAYTDIQTYATPDIVPRQMTVDGTTVTTTFNVQVDVDEFERIAAGDPVDRKSVVVTVTWSEGPIDRQVQLETLVARSP